MKNCLAIWCTEKTPTPNKKLNVDLHINLWQLRNKDKGAHNKIKNFLDIGIKVFEPINVDKIHIYFPFKVDKKEVEDLGQCFEDNNKIVQSIFNEEFVAQPIRANSKILRVNDADNNFQFYIYAIGNGDEIELSDNYEGTVVDIKLKEIIENKPIYYRIRISSENIDTFYTHYNPQSEWLDSHLATTQLIDFRVNEKRNLDKTLLQDMRLNGDVFFKKVDYFVMREFKYDYISSHKEMLRSRRLEEDLWNVYLGENCECGRLIAYHWSFENTLSFNAFVKFRFVSSNWMTKARFIMFLILVGFIGGVLGTILINYIISCTGHN